MSGLWRCSNCGEGGGPNAGGPAWKWAGTERLHYCRAADPPETTGGTYPCRWFGDGNGNGLPDDSRAQGTRPAADALAALVKERGALVTSADCGQMEIAAARTEGRFFVDADGLGYVLRPQGWLANAE